MDDFQLCAARVEAVDAGDHPLHRQAPVDRVHHLLPERVLVVVVDDEVGG